MTYLAAVKLTFKVQPRQRTDTSQDNFTQMHDTFLKWHHFQIPFTAFLIQRSSWNRYVALEQGEMSQPCEKLRQVSVWGQLIPKGGLTW
jgi:hypothetical protein